MPLFEFRCENCEAQFEELVRQGEQPECPHCESSQVEKLMSVAAGRVTAGSGNLPIASSCPPSDAPPCSPHCCRLQ
ncbi:MAG: zinc ribbon domain-containing protein [Planctomycetaceae bacterium]|nr:zinc ribbon domain-containing protein [Planctomycetaceae bacterium]